MTEMRPTEIQRRLLCILSELERQSDVAATYSKDHLPFADEMNQVREFATFAEEYGLAYESLVATIESHPFLLSGRAAISLLELGLTFGFKTELAEDRAFDRRPHDPN
jgi:hypothetical protein